MFTSTNVNGIYKKKQRQKDKNKNKQQNDVKDVKHWFKT